MGAEDPGSSTAAEKKGKGGGGGGRCDRPTEGCRRKEKAPLPLGPWTPAALAVIRLPAPVAASLSSGVIRSPGPVARSSTCPPRPALLARCKIKEGWGLRAVPLIREPRARPYFPQHLSARWGFIRESQPSPFVGFVRRCQDKDTGYTPPTCTPLLVFVSGSHCVDG